MSNLEDLVPPLALCRKIPEGKFAESAMVWANNPKAGFQVMSRIFITFDDNCEHHYEGIPAPTLQEIISDFETVTELKFYPYLPKIWEITLNMPDYRHFYIAQHEFKNETQNAAGIALWLWLDVNKSVKSKIKSKIKSKED